MGIYLAVTDIVSLFFTVAKDLAKLSNDSKIRRRHSITLCESRNRKSSTDSTTSEASSISRNSPPKEFTSLNVANFDQIQPETEFENSTKSLKTLDLRLEEVAHIRSVLTKAELEAMAIDSQVRESILRGKVAWFPTKYVPLLTNFLPFRPVFIA